MAGSGYPVPLRSSASSSRFSALMLVALGCGIYYLRLRRWPYRADKLYADLRPRGLYKAAT